MIRRWHEFLAALMLLTRLPVGRLLPTCPAAAECVWAYPLVGLVVGGVGAAVLELARAAGLSPALAAVLALAATALTTGALHEDGLADTADGFGGGRTREAKLAIMRDSRIGSYGALALGVTFALRAMPLAMTCRPALALIMASVLGRAGMLVPLLLLSPARHDGLAAALAQRRSGALLIGVLLALPSAMVQPISTCAVSMVAVVFTAVANRQVRGYTGDVLGAAEQISECAAFAFSH